MIEKRRGDTISAPRIWSFAQQSPGAGAAADLPVSDGRTGEIDGEANRKDKSWFVYCGCGPAVKNKIGAPTG